MPLHSREMMGNNMPQAADGQSGEPRVFTIERWKAAREMDVFNLI